MRQVGILGPKDPITSAAAAAFVDRFKDPLSHDDIVGLATLTRLDEGSLRATAGLKGPDGVVVEAK